MSASAPQPEAAPCPELDLPEGLDAVLSGAEVACVRGRDGRTGQLSQIAFGSRTWRALVRRADSAPLGNDDAICAHRDVEHLMRMRCGQDAKSACCPGSTR
jgi:hypothetical protein